MLGGISLLNPHFPLQGVLVFVLLASAASTFLNIHAVGWRSSGPYHSRRECSYRETRSHKPCAQHACDHGHPLCCVEITRDSSWRIRTEACLCDQSVWCDLQASNPPGPPAPPPPTESPQEVEPEEPDAKTPKDDKLGRGRGGREKASGKYCTRKRELRTYKPCQMKFCRRPNLLKDHECCRRKESITDEDTCLCHPDAPCKLEEENKPDDECDENSKDDNCIDGSKESPDSETAESPDDNPDDETDDSPAESPDDNPDDETDDSPAESPDVDEDDEESPPPSLCAGRLRLLNADKVDDPCRYMGVARLTRRTEDEDALVCNAVYTIAQIDGVVQRAFLTPQACGQLLEDESIDLDLELQVGDQVYPVQEPIFSTSEGPNGNWYMKIASRFANLFRDLGACQENACPYDPIAMRGKVDFNTCKAVSYGATNASTFTADGLYETSVAFYPGGCLDQEDFFDVKSTLCFRTIDDENAYCSNDAGAPVYCSAFASKEWILIGMLAFQNKCDTNAELKVIPFPL